MNSLKTFESLRLILKPTTTDDAAFLLELMNSPKWLSYIGDRDITSQLAAKNYIKKKILPQYNRLGYGNYTLIRKSDGLKIGTIGLYDRSGLDGIDLGFALLPDFEKQGYAFEAAVCIKQLAFTQFKLVKLSGITLKKNLESQHLLEKLGFNYIRDIQLDPNEDKLMLYQLYSV